MKYCFLRLLCTSIILGTSLITHAISDKQPHHSTVPPLALFSPHDNIELRLINLIRRTKKSIKLAVYQLTSHPLARALRDAHERGVSIEVATDESCYFSPYGRAKYLAQHDIPVHVLFAKQTTTRGSRPLMHNKYAAFDIDDDTKVLALGSYNWTYAANKRNEESLLILIINNDNQHNAPAYQQCVLNFERLKYRCIPSRTLLRGHSIETQHNWLYEKISRKLKQLKNVIEMKIAGYVS